MHALRVLNEPIHYAKPVSFSRGISILVLIEKEKFEFLKQKLDEYRLTSFQIKNTEPILDKETKERLKSLGYVQ